MAFVRIVICAYAVVAISIACSGKRGTAPARPELAASIVVDSVEALNGAVVRLAVRLELPENRIQIDSVRQYLFQIAYDHSVITFLSADQGEADSSWEYFYWRHSGATALRREVYVMGVRDLTTSDGSAPIQRVPEGVLFWLNFAVSSNRGLIGHETEVNFSMETCTENTLVDGTNETLLHIARYQRMNDSVISILDTMLCPRYYNLSPDLEFVSGAVKILAPPLDPDPSLMALTLDSASGNAGDTAEIDVIASYRFHPDLTPLTLGAFKLALAYDTSSVRLVDVSQGPALEGWEYFSWRNQIRSCLSCPLYPGLEFVSIREMNNDQPSTGFVRPIGVIARVRFILKRDLSAVESCDAYYFWANEVEHNILSDESGDVVYLPHPQQTGMRTGPDYDTTGCGVIVDTCEKIIDYLHVGCDEND